MTTHLPQTTNPPIQTTRIQNTNDGTANVDSTKTLADLQLLGSNIHDMSSLGITALPTITQGVTMTLIGSVTISRGIATIDYSLAPTSGTNIQLSVTSGTLTINTVANANVGITTQTPITRKSPSDVIIHSPVVVSNGAYSATGVAADLTVDKIQHAISLPGYTISISRATNVGEGQDSTYIYLFTSTGFLRGQSHDRFEMIIAIHASSSHITGPIINNGNDATATVHSSKTLLEIRALGSNVHDMSSLGITALPLITQGVTMTLTGPIRISGTTPPIPFWLSI